MTTPLRRPATSDALLLWILHRFSEVFAHTAVVKGGMALRMSGCPRSTTDIDYVFVPFESKRDIARDVRSTLAELEEDGALIDISLNSRMLRATVELDSARVQVEASVALECPSEPMSTAELAAPLGELPRVVRVMSPGHALAHKLAAWNERRLHRDLFDVYFLKTRLGAEPDRDVLRARLERVESRLPELRKTKAMTLEQFAAALTQAVEQLERASMEAELRPLLPASELVGLLPRLRSALIGLAQQLAAL